MKTEEIQKSLKRAPDTDRVCLEIEFRLHRSSQWAGAWNLLAAIQPAVGM